MIADPLLGSAICELFETFSAIPTPAVQQILLLEALPALARTMAEIRFDPFSPRAASAMDIVESIFEGQPATLGEGAFATVAGVLFEALGTTEDRDVLQTGLHVITTVVRKDVDQLLNWLVLLLSRYRAAADPLSSGAAQKVVPDSSSSSLSSLVSSNLQAQNPAVFSSEI